MSRSKDKLIKFIKEVGDFPPKVVSSTENWKQYLCYIGEAIRAIKQDNGVNDLIVNATCNMMVTNILTASGMLSSSAQLMNIVARTALRAVKIISFVTDIISLVENSQNLQEGKKSECAEELRQMAQTLESSLEALKEIQRLI